MIKFAARFSDFQIVVPLAQQLQLKYGSRGRFGYECVRKIQQSPSDNLFVGLPDVNIVYGDLCRGLIWLCGALSGTLEQVKAALAIGAIIDPSIGASLLFRGQNKNMAH